MKLVYQAVGQPVTAKLIIRYQRFFDIVLNFIGKLALAMVFFWNIPVNFNHPMCIHFLESSLKDLIAKTSIKYYI